jgi:hypothetical protein
MSIENILSQIDSEIAALQHARALLSGSSTGTIKRGPGRPPKALSVIAPIKKKRALSPEGRAKIAAAVKARWAKQKRAAKAA